MIMVSLLVLPDTTGFALYKDLYSRKNGNHEKEQIIAT